MTARRFDPAKPRHLWDDRRARRRRCQWCRLIAVTCQDRAGTWQRWTCADGSTGDDRLEGQLPPCTGPAANVKENHRGLG